MAEAKSFSFTKTELGKRVVVRGKPGVVKITNNGPAGIVVKNGKNSMVLGAHTHAELDYQGETVITINPSDTQDHTSGTLETRD